jgi:hypothetical protein
MNLQFRKDFPNAIIPTRANTSDIGWDAYAHSLKIVGTKLVDNGNDMDSIWAEIDYLEYNLGISINPNPSRNESGGWEEYFTYLAPRSSIRKYNLIMVNGFGVIDRSYRNSVLACFAYKTQASDFDQYTLIDGSKKFGVKINHEKIYKIGDKIAQLIVTNQPDVYLEQKFGEWEATDRGTKGHGSSGR